MKNHYAFLGAALLMLSMVQAGFAQEKPNVHTLDSAVTLLAQDADLRLGEEIIVEPASPPFNLGGWTTGSYVVFPLDVRKADTYAMSLVYSKQRSDGSTAPFAFFTVPTFTPKAIAAAPKHLVQLEATGEDWSEYKDVPLGEIALPMGRNYLVLGSSPAGEEGTYVMNLRSIRLEPVQKYDAETVKEFVFSTLKDQGEKTSPLTFLPKDAVLTYAKDIILEPEEGPQNLGGWKKDNIIAFPMTITQSGVYDVSLEYSRYTGKEFPVTLSVTVVPDYESAIEDSFSHFIAPLDGTGSWANYTTVTPGSVTLPAGKMLLVLMDKDLAADGHAINLRQVQLKMR